MTIRDRIVELRRVRASELRPNPRNWRLHPERQRAALRGLLDEVGYADALLARQLDDGGLELVDGHLRAETTPDQEVPVLVLDVSADEADKLLTTLDPLAAMAETDAAALATLVDRVQTNDAGVRAMLDQMAHDAQSAPLPVALADRAEVNIPEVYQVVVQCADENEQRDVFEQLTGDGRKCQLLTL